MNPLPAANWRGASASKSKALPRALGVGRGPVREALVLLKRAGLVVRTHHKGAFIPLDGARLALNLGGSNTH